MFASIPVADKAAYFRFWITSPLWKHPLWRDKTLDSGFVLEALVFMWIWINRVLEWPGLKRTTLIIEFQPPCYVQGHQPPDQAAQSHIQPGLECLQEWGIHSLLGQPVPVCHQPLCEAIFFLQSFSFYFFLLSWILMNFKFCLLYWLWMIVRELYLLLPRTVQITI